MGAERVAEILFQRHVLAHEVQHQLVALQAGRQAPFAGDAGRVVAPLEVAERPGAVEHLQRAADVRQRIGKLFVADRATVRGQPQVLVHRLLRLVAPHPQVEADRAAGIERANHFSRLFRQGGDQRLVDWMSSPSASNQPVELGEGIAPPRPSDAPAGSRCRPSGSASADRPSTPAFPCRAPGGRGTCSA